MAAEAKQTRFRSYMLGEKGGSYSYFDGSKFTLIEARMNDINRQNIIDEMSICTVTKLHCLHITSWDSDHCKRSELEEILESYPPSKIEYPGYEPHTDNGVESLQLILDYKKNRVKNGNMAEIVSVSPKYIKSLQKASSLKYNDILYNPLDIDAKSPNDKSTIKFFRTGSFNVLSLGDVEDENIASYLRELNIVRNEVDVMIMAHHGADNGFTTSSFIKRIKPHVAIVGSNYANQYQHPKQEIRDLLYHNDVRLFTTKTGDIVIYSTKTHTGEFRVNNFKAGNTDLSSSCDFTAKKRALLKNNEDTLNAKRKKTNRIY
ncbi:ComEC/Rec2 family competence protein [Yokenella regensburgei]|jgi:competence protein ComEC|uniref:ComEC/Rec2 family competence protein n=1 Tax=Yokenella regensburgei TaxID=158877 RepID=UPI000241FEE0|nr:hypothetical protein [Yokenella regensburgei]EHM45304.1 hypothetical protein HMPREF0880_04259 [Yokenella regensburgei ATCC 43003]